ncbi:unnamed protein product [Fusarium graminearum]|uniref:Chromosome 3, complete genome n=1 Tax=Gibberella zeae (strain ATCC MYA-4620 / CBS 123657 / FGSC 9075 / NRRL 31084 / PH-1) TaxID=229533 RepID=A0A098DVW9_GIBZE|nr:unnamed protein product [Fusarium graminearum]
MTRKNDAAAGLRECDIEKSSEHRTYCFQAWQRVDTSTAETLHGNQAMAQHLQEHLGPDFAQVLRIRAAPPRNRRQALLVPRTIYVSVRQNVYHEFDEEGLIAAFRDQHYDSLVREYFRTNLHKTPEFYNCFVQSPNGGVTSNHFAKIIVKRAFSRRLNHELRHPRKESWGDISTALRGYRYPIDTRGVDRPGTAGSNGPVPQANGAAPQVAPQPAPDHANSITRVTDALRNLLEWLRAQSETPKVTATTGTANSYCRFKEKTETLISLLRHLSEAYVSSEVEGESPIWMDLVEADAARHYDQELTINLNQTGVLDAVMDRHSATKSTAYALCGTVGGCSVVAIGYFALGLTGWPMIFASVVGVAVALAGGVTSCKHTEYRKRVRKVKDDFESFRRALKTVMRILALQFATSAGINSTIKDEHIRDDFLRRFGLDSRDINNEQYIKASLCMDVKCLDQAFRTFTENVDWIDEHEGLGLMRGVEAA